MLIQLKNSTPDIYYNQSRDFQLIGRLYDTVVNHIKLNADMIYNLPDTQYAASSLIDLLAMTLGFKPKHDYNLAQLIAVCSILPAILKVKGTEAAAKLTCQAILRAEGITDAYDVQLAENNTILIILIPKLQNIMLLNDLLDYILPAGMSSKILEVGTVIKREQADTYAFSQNVNQWKTQLNRLVPEDPTSAPLSTLNTSENRASIIVKDTADTAKVDPIGKYLGDLASTILLGTEIEVGNNENNNENN